MHRRRDTAGVLQGIEMPVQVKLAALWASFMFLYAYVDILAFYKPGVIDDILAGKVWQLEISQTWAVGALVLMAIPILMIVGSVTLPARMNRMTNLVVASLYVVVSVANVVGEPWAYFFGLAAGLEVGVLALVLRCAWAWPKSTPSGSSRVEAERTQPVVSR
jgi:hypothetical protein